LIGYAESVRMSVKYEYAQRKLVDELRKMGVHHGYRDRLPLFFYRTRFNHLPTIVELIDDLVGLRIQGLEPKHEAEVYR
jgi:hypothetical protein